MFLPVDRNSNSCHLHPSLHGVTAESRVELDEKKGVKRVTTYDSRRTGAAVKNEKEEE